jgi:plastocyanin
LITILAALSLAACGSDDSGSDSTAGGEAVRSAKVEIVDFAYSPETVTIQAGGKVIWQNEDADVHTATLDDGSFDSGDLAEGKRKSESFKSPGSFAYHCEIHPEMTGTVEVVEAG